MTLSRIMLFAIAITLPFLISSCSSEIEKSNQSFLKKYNEEIDQINQQRIPSSEIKNETIFSTPPTREEVVKSISNKAEYYPYSDISLIGDGPREEVLPNRETYELSKANPGNSLPANIFETKYNLALYPAFRKVGAEFDAIKIPQKDAFGITTDLSDKKYLLIGNNSLQRNIDQINSEKTDTNIEVTKMLMAEKKKILRQEKSSQALLDQPASEKALLLTKQNEETTVKKETIAKESPINKAKNAAENVFGAAKNLITNAKTPQQK